MRGAELARRSLRPAGAPVELVAASTHSTRGQLLSRFSAVGASAQSSWLPLGASSGLPDMRSIQFDQFNGKRNNFRLLSVDIAPPLRQ